MSYVNTLSQDQKRNADLIVKAAKENGITNPFSIAAILAIVSKESAFVPKNENMNYSAARMREVFGVSSAKAAELANKPEAIANYVYGAVPYGKRSVKDAYGNTEPGDGWKYRGRGYNGITFKANYKYYADKIGVDIVKDPEKANDPEVAGKILVEYFKKTIGTLKSTGKLKEYNANDINDFKNEKDATLAFYHANAGPGNSVEKIKSLLAKDSLGGMTRAMARVGDLLTYVNSTITAAVSSTIETAKKKPGNDGNSCRCPKCGYVHTNQSN